MVRYIFMFAISFVIVIAGYTQAQEFKYINGQCINESGEKGLNSFSNLGECTDFRGIKLGGVDLSGRNLSGSNFEGAHLENVSFIGVKLEGTHFLGARLYGVDFSELDFKDISFKGSILSKVSFVATTLTDVDFSGSKIVGDFSYIQCLRCNFESLQAFEADLKGSEFVSSNLSNISFVNPVFMQVKFNQVNLENSELKNAKFSQFQIRNSNLSETQVSESFFNQGVIENVNFNGSNLISTHFDGVQFESVQITNCDLQNAKIENSKLDDVEFKGSKFNISTKLPFSKDEAQAKGMEFIDFANKSMNNFVYYKVPVKGIMSDTNVFKACTNAGLATPCNDVQNGPYSDGKCLDVGVKDGSYPMRALTKHICNGVDNPRNCEFLHYTFQYMGEKYNGDSCGAMPDRWCASGKSFNDHFALCVSKN